MASSSITSDAFCQTLCLTCITSFVGALIDKFKFSFKLLIYLDSHEGYSKQIAVSP